MRFINNVGLIVFALLQNSYAATTLRIMPMGDALTHGSSTAQGAYRPFLYSQLTSQGYTLDFVGNEKSGTVATLPDRDNEAHKGFTIEDMTFNVDMFLDAHDPDIVLLMMGQKDLVNVGVDFSTAANRYSTLIEKLSNSRPNMHIFAANMPPRKDSNDNNMIQNQYNPFIPQIISTLQSQGRQVTFVDVYAALSESDLETNVHPSSSGYEKIATAFSDAITGLINPSLGGLQRGMIRVEGGLDRKNIKITFSKPIPAKRAQTDNFNVNGLTLTGASLSEDERVVTLFTSEQAPGKTYTVNVLQGNPGVSSLNFTPGFRIISLSDWHLGEKYVFGGKDDLVENDITIIKYIKENYGGELLLIPGDTNAGFWDTDSFAMEMNTFLGTNISREEVVIEAGDRCYGGLLSSFHMGGYSKVLAAIGDHELGDNSWDASSMKSFLQFSFRETFGSNFNLDYDSIFKYPTTIGSADSRPLGTIYEKTSFAYIYKNTLIITVDVLRHDGPSEVIGSLGTVTGQVTGDHLQWLDNVLQQGSALAEVKNIIVQGHFPTLYPVKKTKSSGIYMDMNEDSEFWGVLRKHPVDIYFAGEAHLNTVTRDSESGIIQIVGRGNFFTNLFTIDVTDDTIDVTCYNEVGPEKTMENFNYEESGHLRISKGSDFTEIAASGELAFFDDDDPVLYFNFESISLLKDRPVLGLGELDNARRAPIVETVNVNGVDCSNSLVNAGTFGQDYDAQSANVNLSSGVYGTAASFSTNSLAAVYSMGPHSGPHPISYAMWLKTTFYGSRILMAYEGYWNQDQVFTARLENGKIELVYGNSQKVASEAGNINDGYWHHVSIVMPFKGCKLSEIGVYVDGIKTTTVLSGADDVIDLPNGGMMSIGGFGYGGRGGTSDMVRSGFRNGLNFIGEIDDALVFARALTDAEIKELSTPPTAFALRSKISYVKQEPLCLSLGLFGNDAVLRTCNDSDGQHWVQDILGYIHNKARYDKCLIPEVSSRFGIAVVVDDCNTQINSKFVWDLEPDHVVHVETGKMMNVNVASNNDIELIEEDYDARENEWDILFEGGFPPSYLTGEPSVSPSRSPSSAPSESPSAVPTSSPSAKPSSAPSASPSSRPSSSPSSSPTSMPSSKPSSAPTSQPSSQPSAHPSATPTASPSATPTSSPSSSPSRKPSSAPTASPSSKPTKSSAPTILCVDKWGKVTLSNGKEKSCYNAGNNPDKFCAMDEIKEHCPVTCNLCEAKDTDSPTASPVNTIIGDIVCKDFEGKFEMPSGKMKSCANAQKRIKLCDKNLFKINCPVTCNTCGENEGDNEDSSCIDKNGEVALLSNGNLKTCYNAGNNPRLCKKEEVREHCPRTCGACEEVAGGATTTCVDGEGKVLLPNGIKKSCDQVQNNISLCTKWDDIRIFCPMTCGQC